MRLFVVRLTTKDDEDDTEDVASYLVRGVRSEKGAIRKVEKRLKGQDKEVWWDPEFSTAYELNMENEIIPL